MRDDFKRGDYPVKLKPLEVKITGSFEDGFRRFKSEFQREKILTELKIRSRYEKPSEKKRRKKRESLERNLLADMRERMMATGEWDKRLQNKLKKKQEKATRRGSDE